MRYKSFQGRFAECYELVTRETNNNTWGWFSCQGNYCSFKEAFLSIFASLILPNYILLSDPAFMSTLKNKKVTYPDLSCVLAYFSILECGEGGGRIYCQNININK